jgi:hypothetical protein
MDFNEFNNPGSSLTEREYDRIIRLNLERASDLIENINESLDRTDGILSDLKPEVDGLSEQTREFESQYGLNLDREPDLSTTIDAPNLSPEIPEPDIDFDLELG